MDNSDSEIKMVALLTTTELLEAKNLNLRMQVLGLQRAEALREFEDQEKELVREITAWRARAAIAHNVNEDEVRFDLNDGRILPNPKKKE